MWFISCCAWFWWGPFFVRKSCWSGTCTMLPLGKDVQVCSGPNRRCPGIAHPTHNLILPNIIWFTSILVWRWVKTAWWSPAFFGTKCSKAGGNGGEWNEILSNWAGEKPIPGEQLHERHYFFLTKKGIFLHFATCTQLWLITFIFSFPVRPRWPQVKIESPPPQVIGAVGPKQGLELPKILGWIFR